MQNVLFQGYFKTNEGSLYEEFVKVAEKLAEKYRFALTTNEEVLQKFQHQNEVVVNIEKRYHSKLEDSSVVVPAGADLRTFVESRM